MEAYNLESGTEVTQYEATVNVLRARAHFWQKDERLQTEAEKLMKENHEYSMKIFKGDFEGIPGLDSDPRKAK